MSQSYVEAFTTGFNHLPSPINDQIIYWSGRSIRFFLSLPGTIIDIALQIIEAISWIMAAGLSQVEAKVTSLSDPNDTTSPLIFIVPLLFLEDFRQATVALSLDYIAQDLGIIDQAKKIDTKNSYTDIMGQFLS